MAAAVQSSTNLFRRLAWSATVPLEIRLAEATGPVDRYYVSERGVPERGSQRRRRCRRAGIERADGGVLLSLRASGFWMPRRSRALTRTAVAGHGAISLQTLWQGHPSCVACTDDQIQAPRYTYLALLLPSIREHLVEIALDDDALSKTNESEWWFELEAEDAPFPADAVRWHWPVDLVDLHAAILRSAAADASASLPSSAEGASASPAAMSTATPATTPLRLILHLSGAPADKLPIAPGIEAAKTHFVAQVKEADFVRWGNTKRVTSLRRADLEAGWDGLAAGDFDLHARMAARVVPLPIPLGASAPPSSMPSGSSGGNGGGGAGAGSRPPSTEPGTSSSSSAKLESAYAARSLPIKLYLPDGAPAIQAPVPPQQEGNPTTLIQLLRTHLPLLFPDAKEAERAAYRLAQPIIQGIVVPPEAEVAWLAACMAGADGWLRVGIRLLAE